MRHETDAELLRLAETLDEFDVGACPGATSPVEFEFIDAEAGNVVSPAAEQSDESAETRRCPG